MPVIFSSVPAGSPPGLPFAPFPEENPADEPSQLKFVLITDFLSIANPTPNFSPVGTAVRAFLKKSSPERTGLSRFLSGAALYCNHPIGDDRIAVKLSQIFIKWRGAYGTELREDPPKKIKIKYADWLDYFDEASSLSLLAGNVTPSENKVLYIGFGHGMWAYACAALSGKEVLAVDVSQNAIDSMSRVVDRFGALPNLRAEKMSFQDARRELKDGDTLCMLKCGESYPELWKSFFDSLGTGKLNALFGVSHSTAIFSNAGPASRQITESLKKVGVTDATVALSRSSVDWAFGLVRAATTV